ncbi:MAG: hypothetical protein ACOX5G_08240 [Kiritimatiellia bacterium]|jgi:predicted  nucleic acid-binding Zn-ribbon protein
MDSAPSAHPVPGGQKTWYLRLASGGVFGPVSLVTLVDWAKQGRVAAANEVSNDNAAWRPAHSVPELGMSWYIEAADGTLHGPFHRDAAELLAQGGRLGENPRVLPADEADLSKLHRPSPASRKPASSDPQDELDFGGRPAAAAKEDPSALLEERESLRLRVNDLEEQIRQMVRSAEKEARTQERQKEALRKTIAELRREHEDLKVATGTDDPASTAAALDEALETARREFDDEKAMLVQETDALRARIAELEAAATASDAADNTRIAELEGEMAAAKEEAAAARDAAATAESAVAAARGDASALRARITELEDEHGRLRREFAELLAASNERDSTFQRQLEEAKSEIEQTGAGEAGRQPAPADPGAGPALSGRFSIELAEFIAVFERVIEAEHEEFTAFQDAHLQRQSLLRERIAALHALLDSERTGQGGDAAEAAPVIVSSHEAARLRDELSSLRLLHRRAMRETGERERELSRRVRTLESSEARLQERLNESEGMRRRVQELSDQLRQSEQELDQERRMRKFEQEQAQQHQAEMARQIESLQRHNIASESIVVNTVDSALATPPSEAPPPEPTVPPPPRRFVAPPWMSRLRKN